MDRFIFNIKDLYYKSTNFLVEDCTDLWIILTISAVLFILLRTKKYEDAPYKGIFILLLTVLCLVESVSLMEWGFELEFLDFDSVGLLWMAINSILSVLVISNQALCLMKMGRMVGKSTIEILVFIFCVYLTLVMTVIAVIAALQLLFVGLVVAAIFSFLRTKSSGSPSASDFNLEYCKHCVNYPGQTSYCDLGKKYIYEVTQVGSCKHWGGA